MTETENADCNKDKEEEKICFSKLAREGITLLLNNKQIEAETLFNSYPESLQMNAGYAYAVFTDALMTFEDDKLQLALQTLKDIEKKCTINTSWMRSVRTKMFGPNLDNPTSYSEQLESQIILADSYVFVATLTFLQQDISGYFRGGWMLRKSFKSFQSTYNEILGLYNEIVGDNNVPVQAAETTNLTPPKETAIELAAIDAVMSAIPQDTESHKSAQSAIPPSTVPKPATTIQTNKNGRDIDKETISRLLCAVSFGYGLLQLGISLLPPSMLRLSSFLGFGGNRTNGLDNLMFARRGSDMRAPFATLTLLWYHTIVRPFFALDGNNVQAGVEAAAHLIEESAIDYGQSALFLFFRGRVERLKSDIPAAIRAFQASIENAAQREIKMMSLHEVGWCYLIELDYSKSESTFNTLKQSSRWSRPFYSYLTIISAGSNHMFQETNDVRALRDVFQPVIKGTQLDEFLNRRYKICPLEESVLKHLSCLFWKLLVYELLYLWNTLPSCTNDNVKGIIADCETADEENCEPNTGLAKLIEGSCFCILRRFEEGIKSFRDCLEKRKNLPYNCDDAHISAFAQYELGMLLIKDEKTMAEGKRFLQLVAYNYKDYDFEQRLSVRVHALLKGL